MSSNVVIHQKIWHFGILGLSLFQRESEFIFFKIAAPSKTQNIEIKKA